MFSMNNLNPQATLVQSRVILFLRHIALLWSATINNSGSITSRSYGVKTFAKASIGHGTDLSPFALKHKCAPVVGRLPMLSLEHIDLRRSECRRRRQLLLKHSSIKTLHQLGGRSIVNLPQARNDSGRSRIHKTSD